MNKKQLYFTWNENLGYITFITLVILGRMYVDKYYTILVYYLVLLFFYGNVKRIYLKKYISITRTIRRICFLIPLFLALRFGFNPRWNIEVIMFTLAGILFSFCLILTNYRGWRLSLHKDIILMEKEDTYNQYVTKILYLAGAAIGEEIFFRNFMIGFSIHPQIMLFVSTLAFVNIHVGSKWGDTFTFRDVTNQVAFSLVSGILFILSDSCWPSIFAHFVFNFPHILVKIKCIYYKKHKCFGV